MVLALPPGNQQPVMGEGQVFGDTIRSQKFHLLVYRHGKPKVRSGKSEALVFGQSLERGVFLPVLAEIGDVSLKKGLQNVLANRLGGFQPFLCVYGVQVIDGLVDKGFLCGGKPREGDFDGGGFFRF